MIGMRWMVKVREDLTNRIFGKLRVIKQVEDYISPNGEHKSKWLCECDCLEHNRIEVIGSNLTKGTTNSCGCLHKEQAIINGKKACKHNEYEIFDDYVKFKFTNVDDYFYVSLSDFEIVSKYCWHRACVKNYYYVATNQAINDNDENKYKALRLTALIGCKYYDHINGDTRDCRRENLRPANASENAQNRGLRSDNTSGYTGVSWHKKLQKWQASIMVYGKRIYLGVFSNKSDAIETRLKAEKKYFGEFSRNNQICQSNCEVVV